MMSMKNDSTVPCFFLNEQLACDAFLKLGVESSSSVDFSFIMERVSLRLSMQSSVTTRTQPE